MLYRVFIIALLLLASASVPLPVDAAQTPAKGLSISPSRQELKTTAGSSVEGTLTVGNYSADPMTVAVEVEQFSVSKDSSSYRFYPVQYDWVHVDGSSFTLSPNGVVKRNYHIKIPQNAASGGYYFAFFASTTIQKQDQKSTLRAASLVYLTVDGQGIKRSAVLSGDSVPFVVFGTKLRYTYDISNTGNVHFNGRFFAQLNGPMVRYPVSAASRIVMPGTTKTISGEVDAPLLPGLYKLTYGYSTDQASLGTVKYANILYIPPWSVVGVLLIALTAQWLHQRYKKSSTISSN